MFEEKLVSSFDGTKLNFRKDIVDNARATIVIVHGLCEHLGRYDYVTKKFVESGFNVYRFDHRGHGKSEGAKAFYSNYEEIAKDVKNIVDIALDENKGMPVFLLGHSMGGHAVTLYATKNPNTVKGVITSGALTRYNHELAGPLPLPLPADHYLPNELGDGVCSDPAVIKAYNEDPLVLREFSAGLLNCINDGVNWLKANAEKFADPALILHGANDGLVSYLDSCDLYKEISSDDKTLHIYSKLGHEIFNEPCKDELLEETILWINKRI